MKVNRITFDRIKAQYEILKILDKNNIKYTQNKNGLFLNMKILKNLNFLLRFLFFQH